MSYIGKNIRKIRISKKLTQTEFAELFDLKRTAVGSYEEGRAEPKIETLIKIADYYKLSLDQLLRKELTVNEIFKFREDLLK
ncbi:MAG: helix-turn-helix domain-containing protein [Bacteroidales bacterium]|nr:helix-turn-helix domain-containing protein [Bacteroidales bacterium]NOZ35159.1 helix-turn-helix transcriptional regulator [Chlorobiota bacterium]